MTDDADNAHHGFSESDDESDQASGGSPDQPTKNQMAKPSRGINANSSKGEKAKTKRSASTSRSGGDPPLQSSGGVSTARSGGESNSPSGGVSTARSGGDPTASSSGGVPTARSGGDSTAPSGGDAARSKKPPKPPKPRQIHNGGGANSGIPKSMLSAGGATGPATGPILFNNTDLSTFAQTDIRGAVTYNNKHDPTAWANNGHLSLKTCNDGDLIEWMIGHCIDFVLLRRFWQSTTNAKAHKKAIRDLRGTVVDTFYEAVIDGKKLPPQAKIAVVKKDATNHAKAQIFTTEILISKDPTVDGSKEIHRNCLWEALIDTYPRISQDPDYTLQDLLDDSIKLAYNKTVVESDSESEGESNSSGSESDDGPTTAKRKKAAKKRPNKRHRKEP
jgi:hypothetical protein